MSTNNLDNNIKLIANNQDITQIVEKIVWSGDTKEVARKLLFTVVCKDTDYYLPKISIKEGDFVILNYDDNTIFGGILFDIDKAGSSNTISYTCLDNMFYINNSEISKVFDTTAELIASDVCAELGLDFGYAEPTGINIYLPAFGKSAYEIIMMAYTEVSHQNNKKYLPIVQNINNINKICVIEKGIDCEVLLDSTYNITDSNYSTSLQSLVNKVLIVDDDGAIIDSVQDSNSINNYGVVQKIYKQEAEKNAQVEATSMIFDIEQTANISSLSDIRAVSGYAIQVQEPISGLIGIFYIESDTHTFESGKAIMDLKLEFSNMMDEKEIN